MAVRLKETMETLKNKFKAGDKVASVVPGRFRYGMISHLQSRSYIEPDGSKKLSSIATINWYDNCNKLVDGGACWVHKLTIYEPRRHPLTTIFRELPKKERVVSKKRRKRIDRRKNK